MNIAPLHHPNQCACFYLVIFSIYSLFLAGVGGVCGLLLNWIFFLGGGHVWTTLRLRLRLGIVSGVGLLKFNFFEGMFDTYILRKDCGAK